MSNFGALNDAYIQGLTEQGREPEVVHECSHCGEDLYEGEEATVDGMDNYFCDFGCARAYLQIEGVEFEDLTEYDRDFTCERCGGALDPEGEDCYKNNFEDMFCCQDCAEEDAGLEYKTVERMED